ncbi:MAG: hypothetical protein MI865_01940 [Proteobacteria bacterium]|nr:hypothetical protein [Pseudomonadota bacterium]
MKPNRIKKINIRHLLGQSMVEYNVVILFGILTLNSTPMRNAVTAAMDAIRNNYQGYSFAMSLSDIPDAVDANAYQTMLDGQNVNTAMKDVLTDNIRLDNTRNTTKYLNAISRYETSNPEPTAQNTILTEARNLRNLSVP